jgi:hypothetical protein
MRHSSVSVQVNGRVVDRFFNPFIYTELGL